MFSKKSIRYKFILQLVSASAVLIVVFSTVLYSYIKISIFDDLNKSLLVQSHLLIKSENGLEIAKNQDIKMEVVKKTDINRGYMFEYSKINDEYFLSLYYPYELKFSNYLKLTKNITNSYKLLNKILFNIFIVNLSAIFLILFYAMLLSRMLILPIKTLNHKLASMNENFLQQIDLKSLPIEFLQLGKGINGLIGRIQVFVKYQKELFIGIAHELKTPLAVMKTKNEVTLLKKRDEEKYIETLKNNNLAIEDMNKMISSILEIGRQEGAQFEQPIKLDMIEFLKEKVENFKIIAHQENIKIASNFSPESYIIKTQPTLLMHILQNFIQNAIKYTKENSTIHVKSFVGENGFTVEVIDEGCGIDEKQDYFAPFKRFGNKSGVGLGLFLAKGAADAINAKLSLKNRLDGKSGLVATLFIPAQHAIT